MGNQNTSTGRKKGSGIKIVTIDAKVQNRNFLLYRWICTIAFIGAGLAFLSEMLPGAAAGFLILGIFMMPVKKLREQIQRLGRWKWLIILLTVFFTGYCIWSYAAGFM